MPDGPPRLVVFCGLPGVGKTTLAREVADALGATYLRIDTIEAAVAASGLPIGTAPVGYLVAEWIAGDQLRAGRPVVADAVNSVEIARESWRELAADCGVPARFVLVMCSDPAEHRRRVQARSADLPGHVIPDWVDVLQRHWETLTEPFLRVDNLGEPAHRVADVLSWLDAEDAAPGDDVR